MRRNQLLYIGSLIAAAVFVSYKGGNVSYMLFYLLLLIPVISIVYLIVTYMNLEFYQSTSKKTAVKEEVLPYKVTFQNHSFLPFTSIKARFYEKSSYVGERAKVNEFQLLPGEEQTLQSSLQCFYRGEYEVGVEKIELMDFLRLIRLTYRVNWPLKLTVLPKVNPLQNLYFVPLEEDSKRTQFSLGSPIDPLDQEVRKYQQGDSLRAIHWKIAAKKRELWVRQSSCPINRENILILDLSSIGEEGLDKLETEDKILEAALAISYFYETHKIKCIVYVPQEKGGIFRIDTEEDFGIFYKACGSFCFNEEKGISQFLERQLIENEALGFYMIVTHAITEELERSVFSVLEKGSEVIIISVSSHLEDKLQIKKFEEMGVSVCCIGEGETIEEKLERNGGGR